MVTNTHARDQHHARPYRSSSRTHRIALSLACLLGLLLLILYVTSIAEIPQPHKRPLQFATAATDPPIIINEVAWGGTAASPFDEWIELLNLTGKPQSLEGWTLIADDGNPTVPLWGEIPAYGYFVIERTDDDTISDRPADLIASFGSGLSNAGEGLNLINPAGDLIDTANSDGGPWPNADTGGSPTYQSMERVDPTALDLDVNWKSNDGSLTCGLDANGDVLNATPGSINAAYQPIFSQNSDLALSSEFPSTVRAGDLMTAHIDLLNRGGLTATQVVLTASLSGGAYYQNQTSDHDTFRKLNDQTLIWHQSQLKPNPEIPSRITLTLRISPSLAVGAEVVSHLTATTASPELHSDNNSITSSTRIRELSADLVLTKTGPSQIKALIPPDMITYNLSIYNRGPDTASGIWITDRLPSNLTFLTQTSTSLFTKDLELMTWYVESLSPQMTYSLALVTSLTQPISESLRNEAGVWTTTPDPRDSNNRASWRSEAIPTILISSVLYDGYAYMDADEALGITNLGPGPLSLQDWQICKDQSGQIACKRLPGITVTDASEIWIAKDAAAFIETFGFAPDAQMSSWLGLANAGDEIILQDPDHRYVDTVVYGAGISTVPGWSGPSVTPYYNFLRGKTGQIIHRIPDERTGLPAYDSDTLWDWIQNPGDPLNGRRALYPGWDVDSFFIPLSVTESASTTLAIAPDHAFEIISEKLEQANESILLEVYTLRHPALISTLAKKAAEGVNVKVLLEGSPVGLGINAPEWQTELYACAEIETHGGEVWFMIHKPEDRIYNRYSYLHPKLIVIDDEWLIIGTQNLTYSSLPSDDKHDGTAGSRGTLMITNASSVVQRGIEIITSDLDPQNHSDLLRWNQGYLETYGPPNLNAIDLSTPNWTSYTIQFSTPLHISGDTHFEFFTAPEAALRQTDALLGLINRAGIGDSIEVEQAYEYLAWGEDPVLEPNLRLQAYLNAAHRGARVRLLLNGHGFIPDFDHPPEENLETVAYVRQQAKTHNLDIQAAVGNPTGLGIHNKMVLVNLGEGQRYVHSGSINGSETSSKVNREVALQLRSDEAYEYYLAMFEYDWWSSHPLYFPIVTRNYQPPAPPVDYLVISEVYYGGTSESEWVEIFNPSERGVDLSTYRLGDAETPEAFEAMFHFPSGLSLESGEVLVIAVNGLQVSEADLEFYEHTPEVPNMILDPHWGDPRYPFALRNLGDQVLLLGAGNIPIDVVLWGDATYPGMIPHTGVTNTAASLSRQPPIYDTDDCAQDFVETYPPTPGEVSSASR